MRSVMISPGLTLPVVASQPVPPPLRLFESHAPASGVVEAGARELVRRRCRSRSCPPCRAAGRAVHALGEQAGVAVREVHADRVLHLVPIG